MDVGISATEKSNAPHVRLTVTIASSFRSPAKTITSADMSRIEC